MKFLTKFHQYVGKMFFQKQHWKNKNLDEYSFFSLKRQTIWRKNGWFLNSQLSMVVFFFVFFFLQRVCERWITQVWNKSDNWQIIFILISFVGTSYKYKAHAYSAACQWIRHLDEATKKNKGPKVSDCIQTETDILQYALILRLITHPDSLDQLELCRSYITQYHRGYLHWSSC